MSEIEPTHVETPVADSWRASLRVLLCARCDRSFLAPAGEPIPECCPLCLSGALTALDDAAGERLAHAPELVAPFDLSDAAVQQGLTQFAAPIPYPPLDLNPQALLSRARKIYLPVWLLDAHARAEWRAEVGFDYEVVSHRDQYHGAGWTSQQVKEGRVRWEPRLGQLERDYANIPAPALEDQASLTHTLGEFRTANAQGYRPELLAGAWVRAPERTPQDAWSDARPALQAAAAEECRAACRADHIRQFTWGPEFSAENWTLLLLPMLATYYLDDEAAPQAVWIHGQTGQVHGVQRASQARATRSAGIWLAVGAALFLVSLGLALAAMLLPPLLAVAVIGFTAAVLTGVAAVIPLFRVWAFNRSHPSPSQAPRVDG